jgi:hypothetical protein
MMTATFRTATRAVLNNPVRGGLFVFCGGGTRYSLARCAASEMAADAPFNKQGAGQTTAGMAAGPGFAGADAQLRAGG